MANRMRPFHNVMTSVVTPSRPSKAINTSDEDEDEVEEVMEFSTPHTMISSMNICYGGHYDLAPRARKPWYSVAFRVLIFCPYTLPSALLKSGYRKSKRRLDQMRSYCKKQYEKTERSMIASKRKEYAVMSKREMEKREAKGGAKNGDDKNESRKDNEFAQRCLKRFKSVGIAMARPRSSDQVQSRLLQLPIDIKMLIYDQLLPSAKAVHIVFHSNRLRSLLCDHLQQEWDEGCYCRYLEGSQVNSKYSESFKMSTGVPNLLLLSTICRSLHLEISSYFYRTRTFKFHSPEGLLSFGELNSSALENMTSIYIDGRHIFDRQHSDFSIPLMFLSKSLRKRYKSARPLPRPINLAVYHLPSSRTKGAPIASAWGAVCIRLSQLRNLTSLKVHLSKKMFVGLGRAIINSSTWSDDEVDKFVLEPLSEVHERLGKQLQTLEVVLDWEGERGVKDARNCKKRWGFAVKRVRVVGKHLPVDVWQCDVWRSLVYWDESIETN